MHLAVNKTFLFINTKFYIEVVTCLYRTFVPVCWLNLISLDFGIVYFMTDEQCLYRMHYDKSFLRKN